MYYKKIQYVQMDIAREFLISVHITIYILFYTDVLLNIQTHTQIMFFLLILKEAFRLIRILARQCANLRITINRRVPRFAEKSLVEIRMRGSATRRA